MRLIDLDEFMCATNKSIPWLDFVSLYSVIDRLPKYEVRKLCITGICSYEIEDHCEDAVEWTKSDLSKRLAMEIAKETEFVIRDDDALGGHLITGTLYMCKEIDNEIQKDVE